MVISNSLGQVLAKFAIEPVEIISSVYAIHTTGTSAIAVEPKGGYPGDNVGIPDEIGTARVTEAGATGMRIVGKQEGVIPHKPAIDLVELRMSDHAHSLVIFLPRSCIGEAFLQAVTDRREGHFILPAPRGIGIQLVQFG